MCVCACVHAHAGECGGLLRQSTNSCILESHLAGDTPNCYQWLVTSVRG